MVKMNGETQTGELSVGEIEDIVVKLAKEGVPPSKIGLILRDQFAVPDIKKVTGKNLVKILVSRGVKPELPEDMVNVIRKAVKIYNHLNRNKQDLKTKRSLEVIESRIVRLSRYYKKQGLLPADWRYNREKAALLIRSTQV